MNTLFTLGFYFHISLFSVLNEFPAGFIPFRENHSDALKKFHLTRMGDGNDDFKTIINSTTTQTCSNRLAWL